MESNTKIIKADMEDEANDFTSGNDDYYMFWVPRKIPRNSYVSHITHHHHHHHWLQPMTCLSIGGKKKKADKFDNGNAPNIHIH